MLEGRRGGHWAELEAGVVAAAVPGVGYVRQAAVHRDAVGPDAAGGDDADLDLHLADSASFMIVVTGTSRTGKSRSLYEALQRHERIKDWQLLIQPT